MVEAPKDIAALVERFDRNLLDYRSSSYNEAQTRQEFINPFFKALGWDMDNEQGFSEVYKEVLYESSLKIGGSTKAPDYAFRIGDRIKFIVEAKKPSIDLEESTDPAYQLRYYAWNAHLPISILTDFEEFAIYDCRYPPKKTDTADTARLLYLKYTDYLARWDEIAGRFSKTAILQGYFDKYVVESKDKKGTKEVDDAFLEAITSWREALARNIAIRNSDLSVEELNACVQATIDRIVFLRICEDRGIEEYGQLQEISGKENIYAGLCDIFKHADDRYNSGLFHFKEDERKNPDLLSLTLKIDDKVLTDIISSLYPPSPYNFALVPPEILGQVYEQFLGKVIRLTEGHRAKVEDKPEVKKAGGVFYTPTYIVDYIVENTVGKLLEGKTPTQVSELRLLDPACGSGSFLLGAYKKLLTWHLDWYIEKLAPLLDAKKPQSSAEVRRLLPIQEESKENNSKKIVSKKRERIKKERLAAVSMPIYKAGDVWRLTLYERKRILLQNIYGVDIDPQAVEVTKLSLLLKVLEGESREEVQTLLRFSDERALPDLDSNIKCGNSLIGWDILDDKTDLSKEDLQRINPFDWKPEFPEVFEQGGFDAVIGNPPYIRIQRIDHTEADYLFDKYETPMSKTDLSQLFIERVLKLARNSGLIGLICTSQWIATDYGRNMRRVLSKGLLHEIVNFGSLPVFQKASTYPAIFILSPSHAQSIKLKRIQNVDQLNFRGIEAAKNEFISFDKLSELPWNLGNLDIVNHLNQRDIEWKELRKFGQAYIGVLTGMDEAFVVDKEKAIECGLEEGILFPYAYRGNEVSRYSDVNPNALIIYPYYEGKDGSPQIIPEIELMNTYPMIYKHLSQYKEDLRKRMDTRKFYAQGPDWYRHLRPGSFNYIRPKKFVIKGIDKTSVVGLLKENTTFNGANCPGIILAEAHEHSALYILGLINSKVIAYYLRMVCPAKLGGYSRFNANNINKIPICTIDFSDTKDVVRHDNLISLVESMLSLHKQLSEARTSHELALLQRQIEATDRQIDALVYELYGLTEEEIKIVEESRTTSRGP